VTLRVAPIVAKVQSPANLARRVGAAIKNAVERARDAVLEGLQRLNLVRVFCTGFSVCGAFVLGVFTRENGPFGAGFKSAPEGLQRLNLRIGPARRLPGVMDVIETGLQSLARDNARTVNVVAHSQRIPTAQTLVRV